MSRRSGEESGRSLPTDPDSGSIRDPESDPHGSEGLVLTLSPEQFREIALRGPGPVLVDFHAAWCAPCKWLDPILDELAPRVAGRVIVAKLDVDEAPEFAQRFSIGSVPSVLLFVDGSEVDRSVGVEPERIRRMLGLESGPSDPSSPSD